jgi:hypothetical protein
MSVQKRMLGALSAVLMTFLVVLGGTQAAQASDGAASSSDAAIAESAFVGTRQIVRTAEPANAAQAARLDFAVQNDSHGCSGSEVSNNSYVHVCFVRDGDTIWVKDDEGNGRSAIGQFNFYDAGYWYNGYCLNPNTAASGIWVSCSFPEADENRTAYYRGYDSEGDSTSHFTDWQAESTS